MVVDKKEGVKTEPVNDTEAAEKPELPLVACVDEIAELGVVEGEIEISLLEDSVEAGYEEASSNS